MIQKYKCYRMLLRDELSRRIQSNPRYSQRAFARQLQLSPGELSEILRGKRALSASSLIKIVKGLSLQDEERRHFLELVQRDQLKRLGEEGEFLPQDGDAREEELSVDRFQVVADWFCLAILTLSEVKGFRWDPHWIGQRLGIAALQAKLGLERLERVGLIRKLGPMRYDKNQEYTKTPHGAPNAAIRSFHKAMLEKASQALETQSVGERFNFGLNLAIDPANLPALESEVSSFLDRLHARFGQGIRRTEVYQIELAVFRLTQRKLV